MKNQRSSILFALLLAAALGLGPISRAQDNPPASPAPPAAVKPAGDTAVAPPEKKPDEAAADAKQAAPPAATPAETPASASAAVEPPTPAPNGEKSTDEDTPRSQRNRGHRRHGSDNERVSFFQDSTLAAGEQADAVVSIWGSSSSDGDVGDAVVSVFGSSTSSGNVGGAVVSVLGNSHVAGGTVGDVAVSVLGTTSVNGRVEGDVVAVLGNVELGPNAVVNGELVCVGGDIIRDPKAVVHGHISHIALGGHHFNFAGLHTWLQECALYGRPLAFHHGLMWAWWIALAYLAFYSLVALVAPAGVNKCVQTLEERPGKSILAALLTLLLTPVASVLLVLTLAIAIGFVLIPLFSFGLFLAGLFGKVVMLAWLGRRITKLFGDGPLARPVFAVLIGGAIVLCLYTVPVLGFIVYKLLGILGLGVVLYTLLLASRANRKAPAAIPPTPSAPAMAAMAGEPAAAGEVAVPPVIAPPAPVISAATLPRAGFWIRIAAVLLDFVLFGMAFLMLSHMLRFLGGGFPLWFAAYNIIMWGTRGTTIGGIVCGLKVVRIDDRPIEWGVAIVRALGAFLSLAVFGLGFMWVAFDDERQSWHDKIAGTTIVKVPKGTALL